MLLATLQEPAVLDNAVYLRHATAAALLDAFDRRVMREYFVKVIDTAFNLNERVRQWELISGILEDAQNNKLTIGKLQETQAALQMKTNEYREKLLVQMKSIAEMPVEDDTIN